MNNEPVAWRNLCVSNIGEDSEWIYNEIGQGEPLYTHPAKTLTDDAIRYRWLRKEFGAGRETYLAECIPSEEYLDKYIDEQLRKAQEK